MLQVSQIREQYEESVNALAKRGFDGREVFERVLKLDEQRRATQAQLDETLAQSNSFSKEIGQLFKSGQVQKANILKEKTTQLKSQSKLLQEQLAESAQALREILWTIPNIPNDLVPSGNSDQDNEVVLQEGEIPVLFDQAEPHWELAKRYDLIDFELGVKITGAGFPVYKGYGARLQRGLIAYFLDKNTQAGYTEYQVPHLVNEASGYGTGQLPDKEGQMYHVTGDNLYLIPTAEVPVTNLFRDELLNHNDLPVCCTGYTPCFRREAGSYGAHVP